MTQTKKQRSIAEQVASESPYQRAAARWVAEHTGANADLIYGVDFYRTDSDRSDAGTYWEGEFGLAYKHRGATQTYDFSGLVSAGQFIEECVALLAVAQALPELESLEQAPPSDSARTTGAAELERD